MVLACNTYNELLEKVKRDNKKIICFGAGMMPYYAEYLFFKLGLSCAIEIFVDNDTQKWGKTVKLFGQEFLITSPEYLLKKSVDEYVLFITCEKYEPIVRQLNECTLLDKLICYIYPEINFDYFNCNVKGKSITFGESVLIPPIIHYCWFGRKEKDALVEKCIASWRKYCPDFEIIEWNEKNFDVKKRKYTTEAYNEGKWAYVSDVARLDAIYNYGGIYFDTDVELIKEPDKLLTFRGFILYGEWPSANSGAGAGCVPRNEIIREMIETREDKSFYSSEGRLENKTNSIYETEILQKHGFKMDMQFQCVDDFAFLPTDIIAPCSVLGEERYVTKRTIGKHYCKNSWREYYDFKKL